MWIKKFVETQCGKACKIEKGVDHFRIAEFVTKTECPLTLEESQRRRSKPRPLHYKCNALLLSYTLCVFDQFIETRDTCERMGCSVSPN